MGRVAVDRSRLNSHRQKINAGLSLKRPIWIVALPLVRRNVNICLAFCVKVMNF